MGKVFGRHVPVLETRSAHVIRAPGFSRSAGVAQHPVPFGIPATQSGVTGGRDGSLGHHVFGLDPLG